MLKVAVFSDVHGNLTGLNAVLADILSTGPYDEIVCAGDLINKGPSVEGVIEAVQRFNCKVLLGNHEQLILEGEEALKNINIEPNEREILLEQSKWTRGKLSERSFHWLAGLQREIYIGERNREKIYICHASPNSFWEGGSKKLQNTEFEKLYGTLDAHIVVVGHDHGSFVKPFKDKLLVNISSVSQNYGTSTESTYCVFTWDDENWTIQFNKVSYSLDSEVARINSVDMPLFIKKYAFPMQPIYERI